MLKVGLPRALLYYQYYPYWSVFFETLGTKVVPSPVTNEDILMSGVQNAVDDCCLPVKCYFGHVLSLQDQVDVLFVPRVVCDRIGGLQCPKILGLPDMVQGLGTDPGNQAPTVDVRRTCWLGARLQAVGGGWASPAPQCTGQSMRNCPVLYQRALKAVGNA